MAIYLYQQKLEKKKINVKELALVICWSETLGRTPDSKA